MMLTVPEVLRLAGHPPGRRTGARWRTTCPLTKGDNAESFSYTDEVWHCFACAESGGIVKLAKLLGVLADPVPRPGIEGLPDARDVFARDRQALPEPKLSAELARIGAAARERILAAADRLHCAAERAHASEIPRYLDQMGFDYQNDGDARFDAFATAAYWWADVQAWKDCAHHLYAAVALDPELAERDVSRALAAADDARFCPCEAAPTARGTRARPRLA
jgi:hypothetical protein